MKAACCGALALVCILLPCVTVAAELKLATWNLEWLTERQAELPPDVRPRQPDDIDRLRNYANELDADVIAVQEVDGPAMAARVFPSDKYSVHMSHDPVIQRVGIIVRRGIHYIANPDVTGFELGQVGCAAASMSRCACNPPCASSLYI